MRNNNVLNASVEVKKEEGTPVKNETSISVIEYLRKCDEQVKKLQAERPEGWLNQCISVYEEALAQEKVKLSKARLALVQYSYVQLLQCTCRFSRAKQVATENVALLRELCDTNPQYYQPKLASTLGQLAYVHSCCHQYEFSEQEFMETIAILRKLAETSDVYVMQLVENVNALAVVHCKQGLLEQAEPEYEEAIRLCQLQAGTLSDEGKDKEARCYANLATLHCRQKRHEQAVREFQFALQIFRELMEKDPKYSLPSLANALCNLGSLYMDINQFDLAEQEYQEALSIYRQLAEKTPEAFNYQVERTIHNIELLHLKQEGA